MGVATGASAYSQYGFETAFGVEQATRNKVFGLEEKISGWSWQNNQLVLSELNNVQPAGFAYGQNSGRYTVDFILSNPWIFQAILNNNVDAGAGPYTHTMTPTAACKTISHEIGMDLATNQVRVALGAMVNSLSIRGSINELIRGSAEVIYGKEKTVSTTLDTTPAVDDIDFPYTFVHGSVELPNSTVLAEIQSVDMTLNQNAELLYGFGSANAVNGIRKRLDVSGRINLTLTDNVTLGYINSRAEVATMKLKFSNGLSGTNERTISLNGVGIGLSELNLGSVEPNEVIFQDVNFVWRGTTMVATNNTASPP